MKKFNWLLMLAVVILISGFSYMAYGQTTPIPGDDPGSFVKYFVEAFQGGNWALAIGLVIMLGVWLTSKFLKVNNEWLPLISSVYGVLGSILASVIAGQSWVDAVVNGLVIGTSASGFWSLLGKHLLPKK